MAFTTLEDRFNQVSTQIYNRYSTDTNQYVSIKPNTNGVLGSNSNIQNDTQSLPIVSTARDVSRITKYWNSPEGRLVIGKQLLLQTGNTFAESRLYNPLSPILNLVPFLHFTRHFGRPLFNFKTPTRDLRGALQQETLDRFITVKKQNIFSQVLNTVKSPFTAYKYKPKFTEYFSGDATKEFYLRPEDTIFHQNPLQLIWSRGSGRFASGYLDKSLYSGPILFDVQPMTSRGSVKQRRDYKTNFVQQLEKFAKQKPRTVVGNNNKTFKELESTSLTRGYFESSLLDVLNVTPTTDNAERIRNTTTFDGDPFNQLPSVTSPYLTSIGPGGETRTREIIPGRYDILRKKINNPSYDENDSSSLKKDDIIDFSFNISESPRGTVPAITETVPIRFRAFLSSHKETTKPEFTEHRYLGRTERFVTYSGAKRTASLQFNVVALSKIEIQQVWERINFLTGLTFPRGKTKDGFNSPQVFKITIGGIYDNQPCYIESLEHTFIDDSTTFNIDARVSQHIQCSMNIVLLEKRSRFYDSPFYKITENLSTTTPTPSTGPISTAAREQAINNIRALNQRLLADIEARRREKEQEQKRLDFEAVLNNMLQGASEDTGVGPPQ